MGMFDYYEPDPDLNCPRCGQALDGWQGKDGDNALFVWKQNSPHPTEQCIDDEEIRLTKEDLLRFNLPEEFEFYTHCTCSTKFFLFALGSTFEGVWNHTHLVQSDEIDRLYPHLPRTQRKAMRKWLQESA